MVNPEELDESYKEYSESLSKWLPDGIISIDIKTLQDLGLLSTEQLEHPTPDSLSQQFHVIETSEKVTLFNEQFVIWFIPQSDQELSGTVVMIALLQNLKPHLEIAFSTTGVYNTPRYILKILQHYLTEVIDTEAVISSIGKKQ